MSNTLPQYPLSAYPDDIAPITNLSDPTISDWALISQYNEFLMNNDPVSAADILEQNPSLKLKMINADWLNRLAQEISATQVYFKDVTIEQLRQLYKFKGNYSAEVKYYALDTVLYAIDSVNKNVFLCTSDETPIGTPPSDNSYFQIVSFNGAGVNILGEFDSLLELQAAYPDGKDENENWLCGMFIVNGDCYYYSIVTNDWEIDTRTTGSGDMLKAVYDPEDEGTTYAKIYDDTDSESTILAASARVVGELNIKKLDVPKIITVSLLAEDWEEDVVNEYWTQEIINDNVLVNSVINISFSVADIKQIMLDKSSIMVVNNEGVANVYALNSVPTANLTAYLEVRSVVE